MRHASPGTTLSHHIFYAVKFVCCAPNSGQLRDHPLHIFSWKKSFLVKIQFLKCFQQKKSRGPPDLNSRCAARRISPKWGSGGKTAFWASGGLGGQKGGPGPPTARTPKKGVWRGPLDPPHPYQRLINLRPPWMSTLELGGAANIFFH